MINRLLRSFFTSRTENTLTKAQEAIIVQEIETINFKRIRLFLWLFLIVEILFIAFNDIPSLKNSNINGVWSDGRYFIIHLFLLVVSFVGIIVINVQIKKDKGSQTKINRIVVLGLTVIILVLVSIINGLDQIKADYASSVFIANILICSAVILVKFPENLFVYGIPFSTFIGGLLIFQKNPVLLYSNMINGSIFFAAVIIISKAMYDNQYEHMSKNIILKEMNNKLDYISNHDPLTGLSNRRNFEIQTEQRMETLKQSRGEAVLVLIDIDHFKHINDKFGHPIGDMVIKEVSNILVENLKGTDLAARWGGEEFLLLLFASSLYEACEWANKVRAVIEKKKMIFDKFEFNITASFGVAKYSSHLPNSFDTSYKIVDKALYQAKNGGRNQVVIGSFTKQVSSS